MAGFGQSDVAAEAAVAGEVAALRESWSSLVVAVVMRRSTGYSRRTS